MDAEWEDVGFVYPPPKLAAIGSSAKPGPITSTLVLVGKTGNGKSATGNSILGKPVFNSKRSSSSVTQSCQLSEVSRSGRVLRVIDTPGQFDTSADPRTVAEEIVKCIELAEGGIHGILLVLSVRNRFTQEELAAMDGLRKMFGDEVLNYTILVFTNGDSLDEDDSNSLDSFLGGNNDLNELIRSCGNRKVLFDNKTKDKRKKEEQVKQLLVVLDDMVARNSRIPYTYESFTKAKELQASQELQTSQELKERADVVARISRLETDVPEKFKLFEEKTSEAEAKMRRLQEDLEKSDRERKEWEEKYNRTRQETEEKFEAERKRFEEERKKYEKEQKAREKKRNEELKKEFEEKYRSKCIIL